jgi:transposase-like protein
VEDFPRNLPEFEARFSTNENCHQYLYDLRWPDGFRCPKCAGDKAWTHPRGLLECGFCGHQTSVTAGTVFQDTHKPLMLWFRAMWCVTSQKNGASALGLQRALGLRSYQTAWVWLHKLRRAMVRPGRDQLSGRIETDEAYVGGEEEKIFGRHLQNKALIVVAAQADGKGIGRIRLRHIPDNTAGSLHPFIQETITPGSTVVTDGHNGYDGLERFGFQHEIYVIGRRRKSAGEVLPRVHLVISLLKRWLLGTHQGAVSMVHLPYYLDEFTFRFNRRKSQSRGKLFHRLMQQAVATYPTTYPQMSSQATFRKVLTGRNR